MVITENNETRERELSDHSTSVRNGFDTADLARDTIVSCGASQTNVQSP